MHKIAYFEKSPGCIICIKMHNVCKFTVETILYINIEDSARSAPQKNFNVAKEKFGRLPPKFRFFLACIMIFCIKAQNRPFIFSFFSSYIKMHNSA